MALCGDGLVNAVALSVVPCPALAVATAVHPLIPTGDMREFVNKRVARFGVIKAFADANTPSIIYCSAVTEELFGDTRPKDTDRVVWVGSLEPFAEFAIDVHAAS